MKTIIITDPCYTTEGSSEGGSAEVKIEVSDGFFNVLKQEPIVKFNPDDNWDGGTYFFGGSILSESMITLVITSMMRA